MRRDEGRRTGRVAELTEEMRQGSGEVIYVALGTDKKKDIPNLLWVLNNFRGHIVVILHVHLISKRIPFWGTGFSEHKVSEKQVAQYRDAQRKKMKNLLQQYMHICTQTNVKVKALVVFKDDVFKGIQELVARHQIKRLVMGSRFMSKQAVLQQCCQTWLVSNGEFISNSEPDIGDSKRQIGLEENFGQSSSSLDSDDCLQYMTPPNELEDADIFEQANAQDSILEVSLDQTRNQRAVNDVDIGLLRIQVDELKRKLEEAEENAHRANEAKVDLEQQLAILQKKNADQEKEILEIRMPTNCMEFSKQDIRLATKNFHESQKIGEGGYGPVYKGVLRHAKVAIKLLNKDGNQGRREFEQEVIILSKIRHPHLVVLIGVCSETSSLIYEYLPSGNLEERLSRKNRTPPLPWQVRIRIISEQHSALIFLHSSKPQCIVHSDVKLANIFLDANNVSRLGDFGTARFIHQDGSNETSICCNTTPMGTMGYMDPTFLSTGELTPASDVYSFGIVILRLLTGLPVLKIAAQVEEALKMGVLQQILDSSAGDWPVVQAEQLLRLALRCCHMERESRPNLASDDWRTLEILNAMAGNQV